MATTKTKARTKAAPRRRTAAAGSKKAAARTTANKTAVGRTTELSDDVLKSLESSQRAAIEAVHRFVDVVDQALPVLRDGEAQSRRQEVVDSAMDMADRLVKVQYEFIRKVVDSAGKALNRPDGRS